ncbi:hypothetical protein KL86DYS2_12045 [uncultured Dysgonomonas sp.]|uniref:Uncharacterized protein n=1 Tax=uncultured Dysgonomonas sp. TaxID=206096 RepID=A0A212JPX8_9BACT|nr:hypothetical protein KL86DYS2_12045 [uncultured Dysgonomonas sp.]
MSFKYDFYYIVDYLIMRGFLSQSSKCYAFFLSQLKMIITKF